MDIQTIVSFTDKEIKDILIAKATESVKPVSGGSQTVSIATEKDSISAKVMFNGLKKGG